MTTVPGAGTDARDTRVAGPGPWDLTERARLIRLKVPPCYRE
jgi:hypothetical protein